MYKKANKKTLILFALLCFLCNALSAQNLTVTKFTETNDDLEAYLEPVKDINNENCALIKVVLGNIDIKKIGFLTKGGIEVTKVVDKPSIFQKWVYVSYNTLGISVFTQGYGSIPFYEFPNPVKSNKTYLMELRTDVQIETKIKQVEPEYITINTIPTEGVEVWLDNKKVGETPLTSFVASIGKHAIKLIKNLYFDINTEINIVEKKQQGQNEFSFTLKPKFGSLTINTTEEFKGAKVFIDEEDKGLIPITIDFIKAGTHKLLIKKNLYANYETSFEMNEGDKKNIPNITLTPLFALLSITTQPDYANIYLNKKKLGIGKISNYKLNGGQYELELNADNYKPISKTIHLLENQQYTEMIRLEQQVGKIDINTFPTGCEIFLNGKKQDLLSPVIFRNIPVGNYEVEIKKQGYNILKKNITVLDEQTTKINETLINTKKINISTQPSGEMIIINDKNMGISPLLYEFNL